MNLYFDNSSTSFPKPQNVIDSINNFSINIGASPSRGYYDLSIKSSKILFECRELLCDFFKFDSPENIVFSYNATYAFNILLQSIVNSNIFNDIPHFLVSNLDHNCTLRPLIKLKNKNKITLDIISCDQNMFLNFNELYCKITSKTKFIVISHMSNVLGNIQNIEKLSDICKKLKIFLILDIAQSAGLVNIDLTKIYFSALIFTGHKNLFSTSGIGGFIISNELLNVCDNYFLGGTGSSSSSLLSKSDMPDYFEIGTHNMIGIYSLLNGVKFINTCGLNFIYDKKKEVVKNIYDQLSNINDIIIINNVLLKHQNSNLCINFKNLSPDVAAHMLNKYYGICVRSGLHCSPNTHKIINTYPLGCIRISPSIFNDVKDVNYLVSSIKKICNVSRRT